ncbi:ethylene responsive transcription factor 1b [Trifolium pratense]|uniref:Ethylene responsive transcription factor 1b n=1 Tax=Trifolium pratense TaxID=57577 RepID=A0A2K3NEE3_TRIPR|nr:ethylene responsive transcription factor 1b [Trifolium pratense]
MLFSSCYRDAESQRCREYKNANKSKRIVTDIPRSTVWISWKPPVNGWVKLNTDGACKGKDNSRRIYGGALGCFGGTEIRVYMQVAKLLDQAWEVKIAHSYREVNSCADALANIGYSLHLNIVYFDKCPSQVSHLVSADNRGITSPRLIPFPL